MGASQINGTSRAQPGSQLRAPTSTIKAGISEKARTAGNPRAIRTSTGPATTPAPVRPALRPAKAAPSGTSSSVRRHPQRRGQHRPFVLFDRHQIFTHQWSARRETAPSVGAARWQTAQFQPESDAGTAPGDIILQIAVQALKTRVDIRGHRDQDQFDVDFVQTEIAGQAAQAEVGTVSLGGVRRGLDLFARFRGAGVRCCWDRFLRQQSVDMTLRDVEPAKSIVRFRIGGTAPSDGRSDARLDQLETSKHMDQRLIETPTPTRPHKRERESARVYAHWSTSG